MSANLKDLHAKQQHYVDCIERLAGGAIKRLEWEKLYSLLDDLTEGVPVILQPITAKSKFARGRLLSTVEKFESIQFLSYPKKENCKQFGRCNKPESPVMYAGVGTELVLSEIGAKPGDIVGLLHMSPATEILCARLGALNLWRRTSGQCLMHDSVKEQIQRFHNKPEHITDFLLDAFISDFFSRRGSEEIYKLTSAYTSVILGSHPNISGLIYDSVNHEIGACLAIKPDVFDSMLKPTEAQMIKVTSYLGYGIYDFVEIARASRFKGDSILWD